VDGGEAALNVLHDRGRDIALMILDLVMPDLDGLSVLRRMREEGLETPVIVQTAQGGIDTAVNAMRLGAFDFFVKPISPERLEVSITNALKVDALEGEVKRLKRSADGTLDFRDVVTRSPLMERVIRLGKKAAGSNIPILIEGESGVGKELIARAIHGMSDRRGRKLVTVNCGAIPDNLVESILFGHEKGAFTGATEKHVGKFVEADGGTLFLDEVGDLPLDAQVKLLRAVQTGEVDPVGGRKPVKVDIRLISATHRDLVDRVRNGSFREDLFYRLNVFPIFVPPLRERREDIPDLARHFMARFAAEEGKRQLSRITPEAVTLLQSYDWPGNIRQLENAVFRAVVLSEGDRLTANEFPQIRAQAAPDVLPPESADAEADDPLAVPTGAPDVPRREADISNAAAEVHEMSLSGRFGLLRALDERGEVRPLADIESDMIRFAIARYGGQMSEVARRLGIGRSTLYRKLREYGIDAREESSDTDVAQGDDNPSGPRAG
jgi:DNA-binding NtrC family response regulator